MSRDFRQGNRPGQGVTAPGADPFKVDGTAVRKVIAKDDPKALVELTEKYGKHLADARLATSQIRSIFGSVRQMESRWYDDKQRNQGIRDLLMLKPKLAYQEVRHKPQRREDPNAVGMLRAMLEPAIDAVIDPGEDHNTEEDGDNQKRFRRFMEYFEALLAYHKAYGGADKAQAGR
jgi:CRISPR-associated protein Csm2